MSRTPSCLLWLRAALEQTILSLLSRSNECWIATASGNVTRARSIIRIREESRWDMQMVQRICGTPMHPNPLDEEWDADVIEADHAPHGNRDDQLREKQQRHDNPLYEDAMHED